MNSIRYLLLAISLFSVGCGSGPAVPTVGGVGGPAGALIPGVSCGPGQVRIGNYCGTGANFQQACYSVGGQMGSIGGRELCRLTYNLNSGYSYFSFSGYNSFPRLTPSEPSGPYAYSTGIVVHPGDRLNYSGNGGWGGTSVSSYRLFGFIPVRVGVVRCNDFSLSGYNDGQRAFNQGVAAGLVASDGTEVFLLGSAISKTISHAGMLRIGFNTPSGVGSCASATISQLSVLHCEDSTGTAYPCQ